MDHLAAHSSMAGLRASPSLNIQLMLFLVFVSSALVFVEAYLNNFNVDLKDLISEFASALFVSYVAADMTGIQQAILALGAAAHTEFMNLHDRVQSLSNRIDNLENIGLVSQEFYSPVNLKRSPSATDSSSEISADSVSLQRLEQVERQEQTRAAELQQALLRIAELEHEKSEPRTNPLPTFKELWAQQDQLPAPEPSQLAVMAAAWPVLEKHHTELWDRFKGLQREISKLQASRDKQHGRLHDLERRNKGYMGHVVSSDDDKDGSASSGQRRSDLRAGQNRHWQAGGHERVGGSFGRGGSPRRGGHRGAQSGRTMRRPATPTIPRPPSPLINLE